MIPRRSLSLPIVLAIVMIVMLVLLTVGWVLLAVRGALSHARFAPLYWTLLSVGTTLIVLVVVGVILYLTLSIKAINLNQRQSNFIDSVTHELKSPIASLKLYLQTLARHPVSSEVRGEFVRSMLEDVERLDALINHLLDAARVDKMAAEAEREDVELSELLAQCVETVCLQYRLPAEVVRLETCPCTVRARRVDLELVFRNLIDNAVKYAGDPPRVWVWLGMPDDQLCLARIADNGRGIPRKLRRKIFGRFVRLGMELERKKPGTGLGLYIVRTVVRQLRGSVRVSDRVDGPGTIFEVRLPARAARAGDQADDAAPRPTQAAETA